MPSELPTPVIILLIVAAALLVIVVLPCIFMFRKTGRIADKLYEEKLVKSSPEKWQRECSAPDNEEHVRMWNIGLEWREKAECKVTEVMIENDGLKLWGEYLDFGADKCVMVVPGRAETLMYSYFFAEGYRGAHVNFLLTDPRAHGKSDGIYSYCGIKESSDVLAWARYAKTVLGNKKVILHGICIGAAACFIAKEKDDGDYIDKIISEGCFTTFYESFRQHIICEKKPVQPLLAQLRHKMKKKLGIDIKKDSPIKAVAGITVPVLFIAGRQDLFSVPKKSTELYSTCKSQDKKLVFFGKGAHSHLRINNMEQYDSNVVRFVER